MKKTSAVLLLFLFALVALQAESTSPATTAAAQIALGQSIVALNGPWKFHLGDNPRWADPNFDDSGWETADLTPTPKAVVPGVPIPEFVSGWEARGHPGYAGYAWYRMRVRISGASGPLELLSPEWFDDAFQVFANGRLIGSFGNFSGPAPVLYETNPARFILPASDYAANPDGSMLIAFRFYMSTKSVGTGVRGGMHGPPRIGLPGPATAVFHMEWEREYRRLASAFAAALLYFVFALLIAMIFAFSRSDKILLWPLTASVFQVIQFALIFSTSSRWLSEAPLEALIGFANLVGGYLWLLTWWAYFGLQRKRWLFNVILALGVCNLATLEFFTIAPLIGKASHGLLVGRSISGLSTGTAVFVVVALIVYLGWKRAERRQWTLFLALFFFTLPVFEPEMSLLHLRTAWQPFGVIIPLGLISNCGSLFFFSIVLFQQFRASLNRQQTMQEDVKQAAEVQQVLIPQELPQIPGLAIESEYRPAREVGGDFFQIIPHPSDGSVLIVVGDVTGHGLQAGMLVALIVGAIRNEITHTYDPMAVLNALNQVLCERGNAHATGLGLHIAADGSATLANAGHLPPYLNGKELPMEGSLPLGMVENAEFSVMQFQLASGDTLMLMSDGVVEAQDEQGQLFGFERISEMLRQPITAAEVAATAQAFGQEDDISVLSVTRMTNLKAVPA